MATFVIARLTFLEAMRRRILLAAFILGLAFLIIYGIGFNMVRTQAAPRELDTPRLMLIANAQISFLVSAGLYAVNFLALAMSVLVAADTLAGEISSGTIQAIVTKPVHRAQIVLGKWLGFAGLLALYLGWMIGGVMGIAYALAGYVVPNSLAGIALMYLAALFVMTLTLLCSSLLSTLATGGVIFGLYGLAFIGSWVEQFGALLQNQGAINIGIVSSLLMPSEALWRRASFEMTPLFVQSLGASFGGPFGNLSTPSELMLWYAWTYLLVALGMTIRIFSRRDL